MIALTLGRDRRRIVGGRLVGTPIRRRSSPDRSSSTRAWSRRAGCSWRCPGEHVDGHEFVAAARRARSGRRDRHPCGRRARHRGARRVRRDRRPGRRGGAPAAARTVIGVTGSSGKTSTKDMLAPVLLAQPGRRSRRPARSTTNSATPTPCCAPTQTPRILVLETSARGSGHIRYLTGIAPPRIGVVLNVGSAHLGEFGSREAIAEAKGELVEALPAAADGGVAVLNADDPLVLGDGRAHRVPGWSPFGSRRPPTCGPTTSTSTSSGRASFTAARRRGVSRGRAALRRRAPRRQRARRRWRSPSNAGWTLAAVARPLARRRRPPGGGWSSPSAPTASS